MNELTHNLNVVIELDYDYDQELGYSTNRIFTDNFYILHNPETRGGKMILTLYEDDIRNLLKGTGITIDGK